MSFLLDTNVLSETAKPFPHPAVHRWILQHGEQLYLSAMTVTELRSGIELMPSGQRRRRLDAWFSGPLMSEFGARILAVNTTVAEAGGRIFATEKLRGHNPDLVDALIGATAAVHGLTLATRNIKHFRGMGIQTFDPFSAAH